MVVDDGKILASPKKGSSLKGIIFVFIFLAILVAAYFILIQFPTFSFLPLAKEKFPALENPKTTTFNWTYKNQKFSLSQTYYQSVDEYYAKKQKGVFEGQEEKDINQYLYINEKDSSLDDLLVGLKEKSSNKNFTSDEFLEYTAAFVQSIPYDSEKAKNDTLHPRYPYEVLYENKGICSDKTFLATILIRKLNYGSAIFFYKDQEHIASAVKCSEDNSNYNSGYCIVESTAPGNKIGIIPKIKSTGIASLEAQQLSVNSQSDSQVLDNPEIFGFYNGEEYKGIIETLKIKNEIDSINSELLNLQKEINVAQNELDGLKKTMDQYKSDGQIDLYNSYVDQYNSKLEALKALISQYNQKVTRYNYLIKQ